MHAWLSLLCDDLEFESSEKGEWVKTNKQEHLAQAPIFT